MTRPRGGRALALLLGAALLASLGACGGGNGAPVVVRTLQEDPGDLAELLQPPDQYLIGPDDVLHIVFVGDEVLNSDMRVTPDGFVSVPLLDEPIGAAGMSMAQLHDEIVQRLARYLRDPQVYLNLVNMGSQNVFVLGYVTVPQIATSTPLTLAGVISACGGIHKDGQRHQVIVVRHNPGGDPIVFDIDFMQLLEGKSALPDIPLQRFDVVIVPKSRVANVRDFVQATFGNVLATPLNVGVDFIILKNAIEDELNLNVNK